MIAGFVILLFIISIVLVQKKNSDSQAGISAVTQIDTLLQGKQQTADVYSEITLPRTTINFQCDPDTEYFTFKIEGSDRVQLPLAIAFAPLTLNSNKVQVWSQAFDMPFPVTVFTYITSDDRIILIYNTSSTSGYAQALYDLLPGNITKHYISPADMNNYDDFKYKKIICFSDGTYDDCPQVSGYDYMKITPASKYNLFGYGNVTFYKNHIAISYPIPYITEASLLGAVFSDSSDYYACQMHRALDQYEVKRGLVEERLRLISNDLPEGSCNDTTSIARGEVQMLSGMNLTWQNITYMDYSSGQIVTRNTDLSLGSCPKIY
jgi:hypothetical protein